MVMDVGEMLLFPTPTLFTNVDYKCKELSLGYGGDAFLTWVVVTQVIYLFYTHTHICICVSCFSCVQLFVILWTVVQQNPLSMRILQARILEWLACPFSRVSSQPRNQTQVSLIADTF